MYELFAFRHWSMYIHVHAPAPRYNFTLCTPAKSPPPLFVYPEGNTDLYLLFLLFSMCSAVNQVPAVCRGTRPG